MPGSEPAQKLKVVIDWLQYSMLQNHQTPITLNWMIQSTTMLMDTDTCAQTQHQVASAGMSISRRAANWQEGDSPSCTTKRELSDNSMLLQGEKGE